ncbi:MAG: GNAT family N-acetyltransferase [Methylobacteriaceae bacterium]|nr:GNAT family N-acetyltransferase [Methylobacteriaceae bacterium]
MFPEFACDDVFRLETRRMWLRWPHLADAVEIAHLAGDRAIAEMTGTIPHPYRDGDAVRYVERTRARNAGGRNLGLQMAFKGKPNATIGAIGVDFDRGDAPTLGYWVGQPFWGRGLATEAVQALIDFVFTFTEAREVAAIARVINPPSRRVLEKCGFAYMGSGLESLPARGGMLPCDRFRLDRKVWFSLKCWRMPGLARERHLASDSEEACPA